jgi:superfamily II DNA helicase RecQ
VAATTPADIRAQQAGHGRHLEEMVYGLLINESPFTTASEKEQFHAVSNDWHRLLGFQSAHDRGRVEPRVERRMAVEREAAELRRFRQMREVDIDVELARFYGSADAGFRGIQEEVLRAIVHGNEPFILAIMPTGGGKSLLFMLPAAASRDGVTIVIVPMVALRQDICERSNEKGIPCAEWDGKRPPYHTRIILATPESAVTAAFGRFVEEKKRAYQLERIVIDEYHMILESTDRWRPKVRRLKEIAGRGVQVLYLTATLPPSEEAAFHEAVGVPEREMFTLRDRTVRPNIAYMVVGYEKPDEDEAVRRLVGEKLDRYPEPG